MRRIRTRLQTAPRGESSLTPVRLYQFPDALSPSGLPLHKSIPLISVSSHFLYSRTEFLWCGYPDASHRPHRRIAELPVVVGFQLTNSLMTAVVTPAEVHSRVLGIFSRAPVQHIELVLRCWGCHLPGLVYPPPSRHLLPTKYHN